MPPAGQEVRVPWGVLSPVMGPTQTGRRRHLAKLSQPPRSQSPAFLLPQGVLAQAPSGSPCPADDPRQGWLWNLLDPVQSKIVRSFVQKQKRSAIKGTKT